MWTLITAFAAGAALALAGIAGWAIWAAGDDPPPYTDEYRRRWRR